MKRKVELSTEVKRDHYSGDSHGAILVWNCSNHAIIKILGLPDDDEEEFSNEGHFAGVLCLTINDNKLYTGGRDCGVCHESARARLELLGARSHRSFQTR